MPLTTRYVRANAAQGLDGLTLATAMNINDALRTASGNCEYRILKDGMHVVTGSITPAPTGLSVTSPAYFVGCSDISGLVYANFQVSGVRQRTDHMPQIMFSGGSVYSNTISNYTNFANLVMSGSVNGTLFNVTATNNVINNCYIFNMSTGSSAQALATAFRCAVIQSTCITSGAVNNGIALNLANSLNGVAYGCYVSAPSGVGVQLNNPQAIIGTVFDTCKRGVRVVSASAGDTYSLGNTFINCTDYCIGQRNSIVTHSGQLVTADNFSYNSGPLTALIDSNGAIDVSYSTGLHITAFNNHALNHTSAPTGYGNNLLLSCTTGTVASTLLFANVSGKDFSFVSTATGYYNRNMFNKGAGSTNLSNAIKTPRLS